MQCFEKSMSDIMFERSATERLGTSISDAMLERFYVWHNIWIVLPPAHNSEIPVSDAIQLRYPALPHDISHRVITTDMRVPLQSANGLTDITLESPNQLRLGIVRLL